MVVIDDLAGRFTIRNFDNGDIPYIRLATIAIGQPGRIVVEDKLGMAAITDQFINKLRLRLAKLLVQRCSKQLTLCLRSSNPEYLDLPVT